MRSERGREGRSRSLRMRSRRRSLAGAPAVGRWRRRRRALAGPDARVERGGSRTQDPDLSRRNKRLAALPRRALSALCAARVPLNGRRSGGRQLRARLGASGSGSRSSAVARHSCGRRFGTHCRSQSLDKPAGDRFRRRVAALRSSFDGSAQRCRRRAHRGSGS
jgi:hypothetical protein